jgi:hypothetical protein
MRKMVGDLQPAVDTMKKIVTKVTLVIALNNFFPGAFLLDAIE